MLLHLRLLEPDATPADAAPADAAGRADPRDAEPSAADRLRALAAGDPEAERWLVAKHAPLVERVLFRILGDSRDLEDLTQEVFVRVFVKIGTLRDPEALRGYISSVAAFVAREALRKRRRHRWLFFLAPEEVPEPQRHDEADAREGLHALYALLDQLGVEERVAFALRFMEGLELTEVAAMTGVSLATTKRRLRRAEEFVLERCRKDETLSRWLEEGGRWK